MPIDLMGVHAEIDRAYVHLHAIEDELARHNQSQPYGLRQESEDEGRTHVGYVDIFREPGGAFGVLIGDALNNLRSALDHLVHANNSNNSNKIALGCRCCCCG